MANVSMTTVVTEHDNIRMRENKNNIDDGDKNNFSKMAMPAPQA